MRGTEQQQSLIFTYISDERRVPKEDPLRPIREMADAGVTTWGATSMRYDDNSGRVAPSRGRRLTIDH
jgi:hypothetical protein